MMLRGGGYIRSESVLDFSIPGNMENRIPYGKISTHGGWMIAILNGPGFLDTHAPFSSDLSLILILISIALFTTGWQLRLHGHPGAHCPIQAVAAGLNAIAAAAVMIPSYIAHILPGIPAKLGTGDYAFTTLHAIVGATATLLGVFVVLRAYRLVPGRLRFKNYKKVMRTSYVLYVVAAILGVAVYALVYIAGI